MSVDLAQVANYLNEQFSSLALMIGQDSDPIIGYLPDIDYALRMLGYTEAELGAATIEDARRDAVFSLSEYYAARRIWRQLSSRVNLKVDDSQFDYRQVLVNAKAIMDDAQRRCQAFGYDVTGAGWSVATLNTDWVEPEYSEWSRWG